MHRVLVTDAEQRSSLAVVRSLGKAGYHVEVCSALETPLAGASRFCRGAHAVPDPTRAPAAFRDALAALVDDHAMDVLLPMTDVTASVVLALRGPRPDLVIPFPPTDVWEAVSDKKRLMEVARELGVPTPREQVVQRADDELGSAVSFAEVVGFPVILKPHRSAVVTPSGVVKLGVRVATDSEDLRRGLSDYPDEAFPVLVQQRIQGPGLGGFFLARDGHVLESFAHRRLREKPPTGGVSVLREGVPLREDLARHSEALLRHFGWSGVAMVEFKEDAATGIPYLMEINGRFWGSLQLAIDSGVDFPRALLASFLDGYDPAPRGDGRPPGDRVLDGPSGKEGQASRSGIMTRWFWGDVDHLIWILRAHRGYRENHPELPTRLGALGRFLVPWRPRLRYEVLRLSDPRPFLRESRQWVGQVLLRRWPR